MLIFFDLFLILSVVAHSVEYDSIDNYLLDWTRTWQMQQIDEYEIRMGCPKCSHAVDANKPLIDPKLIRKSIQNNWNRTLQEYEHQVNQITKLLLLNEHLINKAKADTSDSRLMFKIQKLLHDLKQTNKSNKNKIHSSNPLLVNPQPFDIKGFVNDFFNLTSLIKKLHLEFNSMIKTNVDVTQLESLTKPLVDVSEKLDKNFPFLPLKKIDLLIYESLLKRYLDFHCYPFLQPYLIDNIEYKVTQFVLHKVKITGIDSERMDLSGIQQWYLLQNVHDRLVMRIKFSQNVKIAGFIDFDFLVYVKRNWQIEYLLTAFMDVEIEVNIRTGTIYKCTLQMIELVTWKSNEDNLDQVTNSSANYAHLDPKKFKKILLGFDILNPLNSINELIVEMIKSFANKILQDMANNLKDKSVHNLFQMPMEAFSDKDFNAEWNRIKLKIPANFCNLFNYSTENGVNIFKLN